MALNWRQQASRSLKAIAIRKIYKKNAEWHKPLDSGRSAACICLKTGVQNAKLQGPADTV